MNKLSNQKGGSIVEFTIAFALLGVMALSLATPVSNLVQDKSFSTDMVYDDLVVSEVPVFGYKFDGRTVLNPHPAPISNNIANSAFSIIQNEINQRVQNSNGALSPAYANVCFYLHEVRRDNCSAATISTFLRKNETGCNAASIPTSLQSQRDNLLKKSLGNNCGAYYIVGYNLSLGFLLPLIPVNSSLGTLGGTNYTLASTGAPAQSSINLDIF